MVKKLSTVILKSDMVGIVRYMVTSDAFLSTEEKNEIFHMNESKFFKIAKENKWSYLKIDN